MLLQKTATEISYFTGLDLGQQRDFTALAVLERTVLRPPPTVREARHEPVSGMGGVLVVPADPPKLRVELIKIPPASYAVRHLLRYDLGTPYPDIVTDVVKLLSVPPLAGSVLVIDQTGVGRAVVDMFVRSAPRASIRPVTITGGSAVGQEGSGWRVPKKELVGVMQVLLQGRRLRIARGLANAGVLAKELENFKCKITSSANETFEAWRERDHDDMVLAVSMAAWVAERGTRQLWVR